MNSGGWGSEGWEWFGDEPPADGTAGGPALPEPQGHEREGTPPMPPPPVFDPYSRTWAFDPDAPLGAAPWQSPEIPVRGPRRRTRSLLAATLAALVLLSAGIGIGWDVARRGSTDTTASRQGPAGGASGQLPPGGALDVRAIAKRV